MGSEQTNNSSRPSVRDSTCRLRVSVEFPSAVHPDPLFRMAEEQAFESGVVRASIPADGLAWVIAFNQREWLLKVQHVTAVGLAPTGGGNHRRAGREGEDGDALEGASWMTKEIYRDAVFLSGVLIEGINNDLA